MTLPHNLRQKLLSRFDELIAQGDVLAKLSAAHPELWQGFVKWRTNSASLLTQVVPANHVHAEFAGTLIKFKNPSNVLPALVSTIQALKEDFERGFLDDLGLQIEAEVAANYMGQAEGLLREGQSGKYDHVPAAVLAGAVLERALRTLCAQQQSPIPIIKADGDRKTLNPLIDDLKKAGVYKEVKAKQLRAWASVRNHAAHGEFDQFTRADVEQMIFGINNFLADYLK